MAISTGVMRFAAYACVVLAACGSIVTADAASSPAPSGGNTTLAAGGHHGGHHPHYSLTYLVFMLALGALCYQFDHAIPIPYTVTLLVCGIAMGMAHEATDGGLGSLSVSMDQWIHIDPHVLLFTFLPALLFGDAISMEFASIRKAFGQMLTLATAGVALGAFLCALVPKYVFDYGWDWNYCMLIGSMLAATDPVAVVSLLKEVGASKNLSTIIAGEAMLNDGTAVVFYLLFLELATGASYTGAEVASFFAQMALAGPTIGIAVAAGCVWWIMHGRDAIIEITLFVVAAYASMIASEQEGGASGVLAVVAAGIFVATFAWPYVDDHHSMHNVWHWLEWTGNTLIFLLAGTILGSQYLASENIRPVDWGYMFLSYLAVNAARFCVIFLFFPLLSRMGKGITWQEAFFMSWGGLRGAVGLAMAMGVANNDKFKGADGERYLFHVGGMAFLTLIINGTTGASVLRALGLLDQSQAQKRHINDARHKVSLAVRRKYEHLASMRLFSDHDPEVLSLVVEKAVKQLWTPFAEHTVPAVKAPASPGGTVVDTPEVDTEFLATIRQVFLSSLNSSYEHMIHHHELPQESGNVLLHTTKMAMDDTHSRLSNWDRLHGILNATGLMGQVMAGAHLTDPQSQLTILLCFIEAHDRTSKIVFDVFGEMEGADAAEEAWFEEEVRLNCEAAERAILSLGLSQDAIRGERTSVMIKMLERELKEYVDSYVSQGIISKAASAEIHKDVSKGIAPPSKDDTTAWGVVNKIKTLTRNSNMKKSASGLLKSYSSKDLGSLVEDAMQEEEGIQGVEVEVTLDPLPHDQGANTEKKPIWSRLKIMRKKKKDEP